MSPDVLIVFALLLVALVLFATERVSFDVAALVIASVLLLTGILTPEEGLSGFSNPATITIAAMFVLSAGVRRTGVLNAAGEAFGELAEGGRWRAITAMLVTISVISAFINNTAAVAIFIPVTLSVAAEMEISPSRLLMPLSFASMFGGVCTLIGTSTNLLVSSIASDHGEAPFSMFEFAPLGIVFLVAGFAYLFAVGIRLVPERRRSEDLTESFEMNEYLTDIVLEPGGRHLGETLEETKLTEDLDLDVVQMFRGAEDVTARASQIRLEPGDVLRIRGSAREIDRLVRREDVSLRPTRDWYDVDFETGEEALVEAVIAPNSALETKAIRDVEFPDRFGALALAIRHHGQIQQEELGDFRLSGGDSVLLTVDRSRIQEIERDRSFVLVSEVGLPQFRTGKVPMALAIMGGVVGTAALGLVPIVVSALAGTILMILTGCLTTEEAYEAVNWKVILLLAGVLPLGIAMDKTGAAEILSGWLLSGLGAWGPTAVMSGLFLLSMALTNVISNQATAALLAPIAIQGAHALSADPRPFLLAVTYAASLSFMTPVGYQTNTLVYGPGQYRFTDFTRVGTPLNLLFWILATLLIPVFWPF